MKTKWTKRLLSGFLSLMMLVCLIPTSALAVELPADGKTITVTSADGVDGIQEAINLINKQEEKTGWTIEVDTGTYNRFVVLSGLDDLTVKAAEGADVTVETLNGSTPPDITFGGGTPDLGGIQIWNANRVTIEDIHITIDSNSGLTHHMRAGISNHSESTEQADNFTIRNCIFTGNGNMSGQANGNVGISIGTFSTFTIEGCIFENLEEAIRGQSDNANVQTVSINNNQFINCDFAIHEYAGDSIKENAGTYSFTNNTVTGTSELYNKAYFEDLYVDANNAESNGYTIDISNNTFTNAIVGLVNLEDNNGSVETVYAASANNTFNDNSFVVSGEKAANQVEVHANYQAPGDGKKGYWLLTDKDSGFAEKNPATYQKIVDAVANANATGSTTLSFTTTDEEFYYTFTWFKNAIYWVTGEPKISEPGIDKKVQTGTDEEGNPIWGDVDTAAAGTNVKFKLESTVPENLTDYITYTADEPTIETYAAGTASGTYNLTFHDDMVPALVNPDNYEVKIGDKVLTNDQYTLTSAELGDDCDFHITLDLIKLYNDDVISEENFGVTPITVTYTATLAEGTTAGNYINTAWVSYLDKTSEKDTVTVKTFDITVFKYDQATATGEGDSWTAKGLPGAIFTLYSDEDCTVVVDTATSDNDGYATFTGLDAGTYYLKETAAPEGYVKSDKALEVTITVDTADNTVSVSFANSLIPHTGGMGTTLFSIVGGVLIAMAGTIFVISRRKRRA